MMFRHSHALTALLVALSCQCVASQTPEILVSDFTANTVLRFDAVSGALLGDLGAVPGAQSVRYGPDGNLYVCAEASAEVLRYDGVTGAFLGVFVGDDPLTPEDESGGLDSPTAAIFLPGGDLAVASFGQDRIVRYDGTTGAFIGDFVAAGVTNLNGPDAGMAIGPDGLLYVPSFNNNRILRYDATNGDLFDTFAPPAAGTLSRPRALAWRSDGILFVSSWGNNRILRYDTDGTFLGIFATTTRPSGIAFDPLTNDLLVTSDNVDHVLRFDGTTGTPLGPLVAATGSPITAATFLAVFPDPSLQLSRPQPELAGAATTITVQSATPSSAVLVAIGTMPASLAIPCPNLFLGFSDIVILPFASDANGDVVLAGPVPAAVAGIPIRLSAFDASSCRLSNLVIAEFQ